MKEFARVANLLRDLQVSTCAGAYAQNCAGVILLLRVCSSVYSYTVQYEYVQIQYQSSEWMLRKEEICSEWMARWARIEVLYGYSRRTRTRTSLLFRWRPCTPWLEKASTLSGRHTARAPTLTEKLTWYSTSIIP